MEELEDIFKDDDLNLETPTEESVVEPIISDDDNIFTYKEPDNTPPVTVLDELLKTKGIENSMIRVLDENEVETEINFYDLTREEQLEILNQGEDSSNENLDDSEIELINFLRTNNVTMEEYLAQYRESILAELQQEQEPSYEINNYDDNELFLLDLKNKFDLTDEELQAELEKELANEPLFTKKVAKLRAEYQQLEDQYKANQLAETTAKQQQEFDTFANTMVDIATAVSDFHGVFLEDNEKNETLSYLLSMDDTGLSRFSKDLNDPKKLYEVAWYLRYGKEAFEALEAAYEAEITKLKKQDKPRAVVQNSKPQVKNINELF